MKKRRLLFLITALVYGSFTTTVYADAPFKPVTVADLTIPDNTCNVRDYGAEATGIWYDTSAFQAAIDDCAEQGGGTVMVPKGNYLTQPLFLKDNINFHLAAGAVLQASAEESAYRPTTENAAWLRAYDVPEEQLPNHWLAFINIADAKNVAITGQGIIDGQGATLLERFRAETRAQGKKGPTNRPRLLFFKDSHNIIIEGVTIQNSPSFHIVFYNVEHITINNTSISAPVWWQNTDAIDPMNSRYVTITNNTIDVGDDHIAIKSHNDGKGNATRHFYIANNHFNQGRGLSIGSETYGGVSDVLAENNHFTNAMYGIRIKSPRGKGGEVKNIQYHNTTMHNVWVPIVLSAYYKGGPITKDARINALAEGEFAGGFMLGDQIYPAETEKAKSYDQFKTPYFDNISFDQLTVTGSSEYAGFIIGTPEKPFTNIKLNNINITAERGLKIRNAAVDMDHFTIDVQTEPAIIAEKGSQVNTY